ncbi:MAG: protein kinase [Polyangia bacterium]
MASEEPIRPMNVSSLIDEYRLLRALGRGGMGQVFLAEDTLLERLVALKFIARVHPGSAARQRFLVEARALARLRHPNVVAVYRIGEHAGAPYLVSEYVEGEPLDRARKPFPEQRVLQIALGLARGLQAAHRRGVLHRDIKPGNVILAEDGEVKLLDFGLAKLLAGGGEPVDDSVEPPAWPEPVALRMPGPAGNATPEFDGPEEDERGPSCAAPGSPRTLTQAGALLGTPHYMAPETWRGEPATARSDLYSLGALLFELCTGQPPHPLKELAALREAALHVDAPSIRSLAPALSAALAGWIDRCLRREPGERPRSAEDLLAALETLAQRGPRLPVPEGNPYRGLHPFEAEHRTLFFGRSNDLHTLIEQLRTEPLVLITGDSGVGKSSLCRAGVLPAVEDGVLSEGRVWRTLITSPGKRPLASLADVLAPLLGLGREAVLGWLRCEPQELVRALRSWLGSAHGLLIFIDQLEELVTQADAAESVALGELLGLLVERAPGMRVLATVRGDFLTRLAEAVDLSQELSRGLFLLRSMGPRELREVIVGPARKKGVEFETEALVDEMANSASERGGLPLLQFALAELWDERDVEQRIITESALSRIGGVSGALARYADGVLARLLPQQRAAVQRLLPRLVTVEGARLARAESELLTGDAAERGALEALVQARLLVARESGSGGAAFEIAHEALVRGWATLRSWLDTAADRRAVVQRMESAAAEWERLGRARDALWNERQLVEVDVVRVPPGELTQRGREFLARSRANVRQHKWYQRSVGLGVVTLLMALSVVYWFRLTRQRAEVSLQLESTLWLAKQPDQDIAALQTSIGIIQTSHRKKEDPPEKAIEALTTALSYGSELFPPLTTAHNIEDIQFSEDNQFLAAVDESGMTQVWRLAEDRVGSGTAWCGEPVSRALFVNADSELLLVAKTGTYCLFRVDALLASRPALRVKGQITGSAARVWAADGGAVLLTAATGGELTVSRRVSEGYQPVPLIDRERHAPLRSRGVEALSAKGDCLAVKTGEDVVEIMNLSRQDELIKIQFQDAQSVTFSDNGMLVSIIGKKRAEIINIGTMQETFIDTASNIVHAKFADANRRIVLSETSSAEVRSYGVTTGQLINGHSLHNRLLFALDSNKYGEVITIGLDHNVVLWNLDANGYTRLFRGLSRQYRRHALSRDGRLLAIASAERQVRVWDLRAPAVSAAKLSQGVLWALDLSPNGHEVAAGGDDGVAYVVDARGKVLLSRKLHSDAISYVHYSRSGSRILTVAQDGRACLLQRATAEARCIQAHPEGINSATFAESDQTFVTSSVDGKIKVWSADDMKLIAESQVHSGQIWYITLSQDGTKILSASGDGTAAILSVRGQLLKKLVGHNKAVWDVISSPDSRFVVTGSEDSTARVWDLQTGALLRTFRQHVDAIYDMVFLADGDTLVSAGYDGAAYAWSISTGRLRYAMRQHTAGIYSIALSRDKDRLVTGAGDGTAKVWSARTGDLLASYRTPNDSIHQVRFSPDGRLVVATGTNGAVSSYVSRLEEWLPQACRRLALWGELQPAISGCMPTR